MSAAANRSSSRRSSGDATVAGSSSRACCAAAESRSHRHSLSRSTTSKSPWQMASRRWFPEASPVVVTTNRPASG